MYLYYSLYKFLLLVVEPTIPKLDLKKNCLHYLYNKQSVKMWHCGFMGVTWRLIISWPGAVSFWILRWLPGNLTVLTRLQEVTVWGQHNVQHITPCKCAIFTLGCKWAYFKEKSFSDAHCEFFWLDFLPSQPFASNHQNQWKPIAWNLCSCADRGHFENFGWI